MHDASRDASSAAPTSIPPLLEAACLAHVVDGVSLRVSTATGRDLLVSHGCLGADLTPCQLRVALLNAAGDTSRTLWGSVRHVAIAGGVVHLGGGLYQRSSACGRADERWLVSDLPIDRLHVVLAEPCPLSVDPDDFGVALKPDLELGVTAICVTGSSATRRGQLDEVASWVLATTLVAELLHGVEISRHLPSAEHPSHLSPHHRRRDHQHAPLHTAHHQPKDINP